MPALVSLLLLLWCPQVPLPLPAQVATGPTIKVKPKIPKPKLDSFRGEVMAFTPAAVTVRHRKNQALIRTFSYSPELARRLDNRYIENGDRVTVRFIRGTDTATELKGKIRKAGLPLAP